MAENRNISETIGCLFFIVVVVLGGIAGVDKIQNALWGEREGTIKTDDCRARIPVKEGSFDTWFKKFTCTYRKTNAGTIMSGYCEAIETSDAGACGVVYFYEKKPPNLCTDPKFPYLGEDDRCHTELQ
jgi:hypothetical protein